MVGGHQSGRSDWSGYLREIAAGRESALASLYDESSALVYTLALRILGNSADAEEVTLDVYNQVWREARKFDPRRASATTWLVMMARSRAIDRLRSAAARRNREEPFAEGFEIPAPGLRPDQMEARRLVAAALAELPAEQRVPIELAYYSGLSQTELAETLGQPLGTVKTRIRLGMMRLRAALGPYFGAGGGPS